MLFFFSVDNDCIKQLETKHAGKDTEQQSPIATPAFHTAAALKMSHADQVNISQVVTCLKQLQVKRSSADTTLQAAGTSSPPAHAGAEVRKDMNNKAKDMQSNASDMKASTRDPMCNTSGNKEKLLAVDLDKTKAVWVLGDKHWVRLSKVPWLHCRDRTSMCVVSDAIVITSDNLTFSFCLSSKNFNVLKTMPTGRLDQSAVALDDKFFFSFGGTEGWLSKTSKVCEILHVKQNRWFSAAPMPQRLDKPLVALSAGQIYILPQDDDLGTSPQFLVYDPLSNTYTYRGKVPSDIDDTRGACLVGMADMLYLLGGEEGLSWQYNPRTDQWVELVKPTLRYHASSGCCGIVRDNKILLCGGSPKARKEKNLIEEYCTLTKQWKVLDICLPFKYDQHESSVMLVNM